MQRVICVFIGRSFGFLTVFDKVTHVTFPKKKKSHIVRVGDKR